MAEEENNKSKKAILTALYTGERVLMEFNDDSKELLESQQFGTKVGERIQLSTLEGLYLLDKGKIKILDGRGKEFDFERYLKKVRKHEPNFWVRYRVFRDLRQRGYIVKTALKFGADFRVYDRGIKPGEDHAKWVVYPVQEGEMTTWHDFAAKNRVAHSTKKRLLIGIVDDEADVTYYEIKWIRP